MTSEPSTAAKRNNNPLSRTVDYVAQIVRLRRQAHQYRILAGAAKTDAARKVYISLSADYDDLAGRAEETLAAAGLSLSSQA